MITSEQVRAARALLRMDQATLAERSGVSVATIKRMEALNGPLRGQDSTIENLIGALKAGGIEFLEVDASSTEGGIGLRLTKRDTADQWNEQVDEVLGLVDDALSSELELVELNPKARAEVTEAIARALSEVGQKAKIALSDPSQVPMFEQ